MLLNKSFFYIILKQYFHVLNHCLLGLEWTAVSSKEGSPRKTNNIFKLSNLIIPTLLALLVLSFSLIFKLTIELKRYESEVYSYENTYEDLKAKMNACRNQIIHTEADLQSIRTDLHDL